MPSMPGGDDKKEDDKAPETPEAKAEREQQVGGDVRKKKMRTEKFVEEIKNNLELKDSSRKMRKEKKKKCHDLPNEF